MTNQELLDQAKKDAGSVWRLTKGLGILLGGAGPSYTNLCRVYRRDGSMTSGLRATLLLFLQQPEDFKRRVMKEDGRKRPKLGPPSETEPKGRVK